MIPLAAIATPRLALRPFREADLQDAHAVWGDAEVMRYSLSGPTETVEETRAHMARHKAHDAEHGYAFRAIAERETDRLVGVGGLLTMPEGWDAVEVGYRLRRDRWGLGYATEAACAWIEAGFRILGLARVVGVVEAENAASVRVLQKSGLRFRGKARYHDIPVLHYSADRDAWLGDHG